MHSEIVLEAIRQITILPYSFQKRALQSIQELSKELALSTKTGVPGSTLLKYAGFIAPDDLQIMSEVIENDCNRVDADEWQVPSGYQHRDSPLCK